MSDLQAVQNKAIMWITGLKFNTPNRPTMQQLHKMLKLEPINIRLHRLAARVWEKLEQSNDPNYAEVEEASRLPRRSRANINWWPSSLGIAGGPPPQPLYKKNQ